MPIKNKLHDLYYYVCKKPIVLFVPLAIIIWSFIFREFLFNQRGLIDDARPYYEHFDYYIKNLARGVYPLWESHRQLGVPTALFLRRIGNFNPLHTFLLAGYKLGFSYTHVYMLYLFFYSVLGSLAFFLLVRRVLRNEFAAFVSFVLLFFSALGASFIHTFLIFSFVPICWFFYFLVAFAQDRKSFQLVGMTLSIMIIMSTYVPFYFVTIVFSFLFFCIVIYPRQTFAFFKDTAAFVKRKKVLSCCCCICVLFSCWPGYQLLKESSNGEFIIQGRHAGSEDVNALAVHIDRGNEGGVVMPAMMDRLFGGMDALKPGDFFIPVPFFLLLVLGAFLKSQRLLWLLAGWGGFLFLLALTESSWVYSFLYQHIFYFKYFRNIHFFFWIAIIPIAVLFAGKLCVQLCALLEKQSRPRCLLAGFVILHLIFLLLLTQADPVPGTTLMSIGLSGLLFTFLYFRKGCLKNSLALYGVVLLVLLIQPIEVYQTYLDNAPRAKVWYRYYTLDGSVPYLLTGGLPPEQKVETLNQRRPKRGHKYRNIAPEMFLGTKWIVFFRDVIGMDVLDVYLRGRLLVYDKLELIENEKNALHRIREALGKNENVAFIDPQTSWGEPQVLALDGKNTSKTARIVTQNSDHVKVTDVDVNQYGLTTDFNKDKFLVYNDAYYSKWRAFLNGKEVPLYRANIAFKGVFLPAGKNQVQFVYGTVSERVMNYFLVILFHFVLGLLLFLWLMDIRTKRLEGDFNL